MLIFLNVDSTTRRLNKVLIDSGFAPEWISLEKEIRQDIELFREGLLFRRMKLGPSPLALQATVQWNHDVKEFTKMFACLVCPLVGMFTPHFSQHINKLTTH